MNFLLFFQNVKFLFLKRLFNWTILKGWIELELIHFNLLKGWIGLTQLWIPWMRTGCRHSHVTSLSHHCSGCQSWPSHRDGGCTMKHKKLVFHEHGPGSIEFKSMGEHAFMIEPHMIYRCHKCAFSDIAGFRGNLYSKWIIYQKSTWPPESFNCDKDQACVRQAMRGIYQSSQSFHFKWNRLIVILFNKYNTSALLLIFGTHSWPYWTKKESMPSVHNNLT